MNNKNIGLFYPPFTFVYVVIFFVINVPARGYGENEISKLERLANLDPKPFVIVEASGKDVKSRGQGVVISNEGHVLSAAHQVIRENNGILMESVFNQTDTNGELKSYSLNCFSFNE